MNWDKPCAFDPEQKRLFHSTSRARLQRLAVELGLPRGSYDLRSNGGGVAVSGEITLHHEQVYVQVSQSAMDRGLGVLVRSCRGRRDYTGDANTFVPLLLLDDTRVLAAHVRSVAPELRRAAA